VTNERLPHSKIPLLAVLVCAAITCAADSETIQASLRPPNARKAAPVFTLSDASGKAVRLSDYRGKVVLLNFWATDCGGCRLEIPWFVDLDSAYKDKGVALIGVSMDVSYEDLKNATEAWTRVNPFVRTHQMNYSILMGDEQTTKQYDLEALPATYLLDQSGRIAATYVGLINEQNVKTNIDALLREQHSAR
jgi:cytochrome c biogenesis protein CcmG/thiol:disulfide interchange protein DsbE